MSLRRVNTARMIQLDLIMTVPIVINLMTIFTEVILLKMEMAQLNKKQMKNKLLAKMMLQKMVTKKTTKSFSKRCNNALVPIRQLAAKTKVESTISTRMKEIIKLPQCQYKVKLMET